MKNLSQLINVCRNALKPPATPVVEKTTVTPKRFSLAEAHAIVCIADEERNRSYNQLRVGQAIWNTAHDKNPELMDFYRGGEKDFFHFRDPQLAIQTFNKYYVEP